MTNIAKTCQGRHNSRNILRPTDSVKNEIMISQRIYNQITYDVSRYQKSSL